MKKLFIFLGIFILASVVFMRFGRQSSSPNQVPIDFSNLVCRDLSGNTITYSKALEVAQSSPICTSKGIVKPYNGCTSFFESGNVQFSIESRSINHCSPACLVNIATETAKVNWSCNTGSVLGREACVSSDGVVLNWISASMSVNEFLSSEGCGHSNELSNIQCLEDKILFDLDNSAINNCSGTVSIDINTQEVSTFLNGRE